jgi:subtilisin
VTLYLIVDGKRRIGFKGITNGHGECRFTTRASTRRFDFLALFPPANYWNRGLKGVVIDDTFEVILYPLPSSQREFYDWGHQFAQMQDGLANGGAGVKIAVVDTGIRRDHPDLSPAGGRNCIFGEDESFWYEDDDGHGSHCAGIIAALANGIGVKGYVPRAQIYAYRVFAKDAEGASTFDIVKAIQRAVEDGCDIISMSLGADTPQSAIRSKTEFAYENGALCIAATGNEGGTVNYPAAFPAVLGVGAFGKFGSYPEDSLHRDNESDIHSADDQYYMANFSNFGEQVDFCAPGVAILSTVPGGFSAWDGTSMACPQITGMAALALASHTDILNAQRDAERVERLIQFLKRSARPLGFGNDYEGAGCLNVNCLIQP